MSKRKVDDDLNNDIIIKKYKDDDIRKRKYNDNNVIIKKYNLDDEPDEIIRSLQDDPEPIIKQIYDNIDKKNLINYPKIDLTIDIDKFLNNKFNIKKFIQNTSCVENDDITDLGWKYLRNTLLNYYLEIIEKTEYSFTNFIKFILTILYIKRKNFLNDLNIITNINNPSFFNFDEDIINFIDENEKVSTIELLLKNILKDFNDFISNYTTINNINFNIPSISVSTNNVEKIPKQSIRFKLDKKVNLTCRSEQSSNRSNINNFSSKTVKPINMQEVKIILANINKMTQLDINNIYISFRQEMTTAEVRNDNYNIKKFRNDEANLYYSIDFDSVYVCQNLNGSFMLKIYANSIITLPDLNTNANSNLIKK